MISTLQYYDQMNIILVLPLLLLLPVNYSKDRNRYKGSEFENYFMP